MKNFPVIVLAIMILVACFAVYRYTEVMAPTWQVTAAQQAAVDLQQRQSDAVIDAQEHAQRAADWTDAQRMLLWIIVLGVGGWTGVTAWAHYDKRQESRARAVDGTFALQTFKAGGQVFVTDPNKATFGVFGQDQRTGSLITDASIIGPDRQLDYAKSVQKTRTVAAKQITGRGPNRNEMLADAGFFDHKAAHEQAKAEAAQRRLAAPSPSDHDGNTVENAPELLTLKQSVEQSTPDAWIIGQNQDTGKLAYFEPDKAIHLAILGATGTGKTEGTGMLVVGHALRNGYKVVILDGKGGADWSKFARWAEYHDTDSANFVDKLTPVMAEYERRTAMIKAENSPKFQPMMVMIEEYGDINDTLTGEAKAQANGILDKLIRLARNTGIHLVFIDQYPEKWEKQLLNNTKSKVVYWLNDGTLVKEFFVHTLAEQGEFMLKGERYQAWHVKPMVKNFLADVPRLSVPSGVPCAVPGDVPSAPLVYTPAPNEPGNGERVYTSTELQDHVWAWRDAHPAGTQAELRADFERMGVAISKTHVHRCWHEWPGAVPSPASTDGNTLAALIAQYGEVEVNGERVTKAVDKTQEIRYK